MKLQEVRKMKGITIRQLQAKSGISRGLISEIERNLTFPNLTTICKLAKALDCNPEDLYDCGNNGNGSNGSTNK
jgi:transcriptional regulator with XRE-family HTH domain